MIPIVSRTAFALLAVVLLLTGRAARPIC